MTSDSQPEYLPRGFRAAGIHCGIKPGQALDLALVVSDTPCQVAGVFTTNKVKAAPVLYNQAILAEGHPVRAVVINAGNANACTGQQGMRNTRLTAERAAQALDCRPEEVLVLSTGVIGVQLPMDKLLPGIDQAAAALWAGGWPAAASAIMTTDTHPKLRSVADPAGFAVAGMAKGAGMIAPNMATMLSVLATDARIPAADLQQWLSEAAEQTYNRIVVDGDMSTNDTVLLLANGLSEVAAGQPGGSFPEALLTLCEGLAKDIVRDGEGATKLVSVQVTGAASDPDAYSVARAIATSLLCKTAFHGADPNWGRIVCAAGYAGATLVPEALSLWLTDRNGHDAIGLVAEGGPLEYDEPGAIAHMQGAEWGIRIDLGAGTAQVTVWTCDLSHEYVTINGHYRT